ncbi:MAG: methionine--tRNA ligase [Patescibacteria group bacterium]|nr:methionine--tRNA ligase [Patescibacteria group bacterium]
MRKDTIEFPDFAKLDIRVGLVKEVTPLENSEKLLKLTVDLGEDYGIVTILAGLKAYYSPGDFIGKKFLFAANLAPRTMAGSVSNGMFLAADGVERPVLIQVADELEPGARVR